MKPTIGKHRYFMNIHEQYSRFNKLYLLKEKSEAADLIADYLVWFNNQTGSQVKTLMTDGGREFCNTQLRDSLRKIGAEHVVSHPYAHEVNGLAERNNQTITKLARTMLLAANLNASFWGEACMCATYLLNITNMCDATGLSAYETIYKTPPNLSNLHPFGSPCYIYDYRPHSSKWKAKALFGIMLGYAERLDGYRVFVKTPQQMWISKDVKFLSKSLSKRKLKIQDTEFLYDSPVTSPEPNGHINNNDDIETDADQLSDSESENTPGVCSDNSDHESIDSDENQSSAEHTPQMTLRDASKRRPPRRFEIEMTEVLTPSTYKEAMNSPYKNQWNKAMKLELDNIRKHKVWSLVERPKHKKPISVRWVYRHRPHKEKDEERFRARLVARGFTQRPGEDYGEIFSPVMRWDSLRLLLALCAAKKMYSKQFDISVAFLHAPLKEELYCNQPVGFSDKTQRVCRLHKSLYGIKQGPRSFHTKLREEFLTLGLQQSESDPCVFFRHGPDTHLTILAAYVDDVLSLSTDEKLLDDLLANIGKTFTIKISPLNLFLGVQIHIDKSHNVWLSQRDYARSILKRFRMDQARPISTPADNSIYSIDPEVKANQPDRPYRCLLGSLMFIAVLTRPDLVFIVSYLSRFLDRHNEEHWIAALRVLRYLQDTADIAISYTGGSFASLHNSYAIYTDADFAACRETRRSVSGSITLFNGGPILWSSRQQKSISLSTTECEFISATDGAKDAIWLSAFFKELKIDLKPTLFIDSQSALKLIQNPEFHMRTKHIDVRYKFIRETHQRNQINYRFVATSSQIADFLTKPLPRPQFTQLLKLAGLKRWPLDTQP